MTAITRPFLPTARIRIRSVGVGVVAAAGLLLAYLMIIGLAQGVEHALEQLAIDALFVGLIVAGFGTQVALFVELRAIDRLHRTGAAVAAASAGTSAAAMLACCAHHVVELLPLLGLSSAAIFLTAYKTPLFLVGIAMSLVGILIIARQLRKARRACVLVERLGAA